MWTNTTQQLIQGVMQHGPDILEHCQTSDDLTQYLSRLQQEHLNYPIPPQQIDAANWFIPKEYQCMDIEAFLDSAVSGFALLKLVKVLVGEQLALLNL